MGEEERKGEGDLIGRKANLYGRGLRRERKEMVIQRMNSSIMRWRHGRKKQIDQEESRQSYPPCENINRVLNHMSLLYTDILSILNRDWGNKKPICIYKAR